MNRFHAGHPTGILAVLTFFALFCASRAMSSDVHGETDLSRLKIEQVGSIGGRVNAWAVSGKLLYLGQGYQLKVLDITLPESPRCLGMIRLDDVIQSVATCGPAVYVTTRLGRLKVIDVADSTMPKLVRSIEYEYAWRDLTLFVNDSTLGVVGLRRDDFKMEYNISDPLNPVEMAAENQEDRDTRENEKMIERIYDSREDDKENLLYPLAFRSIPSNVNDVCVSGTIAYVADQDAGLVVVDVSKPERPALVGQWEIPGKAETIALQGDFAYVTDLGSELYILNVESPSSPFRKGGLSLPGHAEKMMLERKMAFIALDSSDRNTSCGLQIYDIAEPDDPHLLGCYPTNGGVTDFAISNTIAYICCNGLIHVVDLSDPKAPRLLRIENGIEGDSVQCWQHYVFAMGDESSIYDASTLSKSCAPISSLQKTAGFGINSTYASNLLFYLWNLPYRSGDRNGVQVFDVSDPTVPKPIGNFDGLIFPHPYLCSGESTLCCRWRRRANNPSLV